MRETGFWGRRGREGAGARLPGLVEEELHAEEEAFFVGGDVANDGAAVEADFGLMEGDAELHAEGKFFVGEKAESVDAEVHAGGEFVAFAAVAVRDPEFDGSGEGPAGHAAARGGVVVGGEEFASLKEGGDGRPGEREDLEGFESRDVAGFALHFRNPHQPYDFGAHWRGAVKV